MEDPEVQAAFLEFLYGKNFGDRDPTLDTVDNWVKTTKMDRVNFWKQYELMIKEDFIKFVQDEATVRLTPKGTLFTERAGLVSPTEVARNREARKRLMAAMASCLTSIGPKVEIIRLAKEAKLHDAEFLGNLQLLINMGYARWEILSERIAISPRVCAKAESVKHAA